MSWPSAAKTPVRSVRTPRVIVVPSTPTSVWTSAPEPLPPPPPPLDSGALVLQPAVATTTAAATAVVARRALPVLIWCRSLVRDGRRGWARRRVAPGGVRELRRGRAPGPGGSLGGGSARCRPARRARTGRRG